MIALVTSPAAHGLDPDMPLLRVAMPEAAIVDWDDTTAHWADFDAVIIRSTWDYHDRRTEFIAWLRCLLVTTCSRCTGCTIT